MEKYNLPGIDEILELLPHRNPFMLVDRITAIEPGLSINGVKCITYNEWYFQGLPPSLRIVPALILCEAIAQLGSILFFMDEGNRGRLIFFSGIDRVRFRHPVRAGDQLLLTVRALKRKGPIHQFSVEGKVEGRRVFEGVMRCAVEQKPK